MKLPFFMMTLFAALGAFGLAQAQSFGDQKAAPAPSEAAAENLLNALEQKRALPAKTTKAAPAEEEEISAEEFFMPANALQQLKQPTVDGSKRGGMAVSGFDENGRPSPASKIFLYYDNFAISGSMGSSVTCTVRFLVTNNLDRRLVSLDVKLVWPGITTALSFSDVNPNTPTYYNYTLMGDGCYTMDKIPNIIVNRCRVKGMSSADCAGRIIWLQK